MSREKSILGPLNASNYGTINGHYRAVASTAAIAPAANAILANVQWIAAANGNVNTPGVAAGPVLMVPLRIQVSVTVATAVTAQRTDPISLVVQRAYTVAETTNTTAVTLTTNNAKARTSFATSRLAAAGQIAVASAAAGISGGTRTADANPFSHIALASSIVAVGSGLPTADLYRSDVDLNAHALILANQEGFTIQWGATALATGTVVVTVGLEWAEVLYY